MQAEIVVFYAFNIIVVAVWSVFLYLMLTPRWHAVITIPACTALQVMVVLGLNGLPENLRMLTALMPFVAAFVCACVFFRDHIRRKLFSIGVYLGLSVFCEITMTLLLSLFVQTPTVITTESGDFTAHILIRSMYVALLMLGLYGCLLFTRKGYLHLNNRLTFTFLCFPLSQYILMFTAMWVIDSSRQEWLVPMSLICVAVCVAGNFALFYALRETEKKVRRDAEDDQLAKALEIQYAHYQAITSQYEAMRRVRHDIANHIFTVRALLEKNQREQAKQYSKEVVEDFQRVSG